MQNYITQRGNAAADNWSFTGANRANTDNGRAWVRVTNAGDDFTVTVYRDELLMHEVAAGTREGAGPVVLAALNDSGLSGSVELAAPQVGSAELDIFYACEDDLSARHSGAAEQGATRLREAIARAKRSLDTMLGARLGGGFRPESLEPLAVIATDLALSFLYEGLSERPDDPARDLTRRFFASAMAALPALRLARGCELVTPFAGRIDRG
jgi:hypothetical protein